ncbi:crotonase/enoyl-CoA hydratase family protein [Actinomarinicola tropica]|uniref:Crotonase/enoyl-CoA hydratase family protein n=1 Tax=Actinomarinicola tropica TaxID=2789776 RepID=A0A5Q2RQ02_9ACTN|nr:crotonase/enoyl-CoA hydratase family protein [Actinomarinicola tropica]
MKDRVSIDVSEGVADVRLVRAEKMNAVDGAMFEALIEAGDICAADRSIRAIVLSGEGRGFCAGLDFGSFQAMASGPRREGGGSGERLLDNEGRITSRGQQAVYTWTEQAVPVIAAVHGPALGAGFQLALGADIRFIHPEATMSVLEIRWGLIPDMTGTQMLPRLVGLDVAKELTFTGRMVPGTECVELGLATHLSDDPHADAMALAREIASKSPDAIRHGKRLLSQVGQVTVAEQFADEARTMGSLIGSPNQLESVSAYFEKRDPVYED